MVLEIAFNVKQGFNPWKGSNCEERWKTRNAAWIKDNIPLVLFENFFLYHHRHTHTHCLSMAGTLLSGLP